MKVKLVSEKQAKLLRYFTKHTGDIQLAARVKNAWPHMTTKARGKISTFMKKTIVTLMAISDERKKRATLANLNVLKGFAA